MFYITFKAIFSSLRSRQSLVLENIALRHQLDVLQRNAKRPRLKPSDRVLWALFSRFLRDWRRHLIIVQPKTVVGWHRKGWRLYWRWKSRSKRQGRPAIPVETRDLIRRISHENPLWGAPRIHGELKKLGIEVGETTVARYMIKCSKPPSQTWRTFIKNHIAEIVAIDFFTVPTLTFRTLYVFVILSLDRRWVVHFNVTGLSKRINQGLSIQPTKPFLTQRRPGAIPNQPLQAMAIPIRNGHRGIYRPTTGMVGTVHRVNSHVIKMAMTMQPAQTSLRIFI